MCVWFNFFRKKQHENFYANNGSIQKIFKEQVGKDIESSDEPSGASKFKKFLRKRIHILQWLPNYTKGDILADFIAGITVGMTMIPQSLAYAGLAGVAPQYGLYTAFIGSFTYVFFGTIKEVSIGPTSLMSLLVFSFVRGGPIEYVILLTFIAGCVELLMGILKLGFLVDFISPCLTSGFTSASALIIIVAQMKHLLGIKINSHDTFEVMKELSIHFRETNGPDAILGFSCIAFLFCFKQLTKIPAHHPAAKKLIWLLSISKNAIVVLLTTIIAAYLHYNMEGGAPFKLTGPVPRGLPDFGLPPIETHLGNRTVNYKEMISSLGSGLVVIPVVAILANVAIAKAYSADVIVDASQEMITLGLCNILGSFVKAMPSCGAFTRSSVASSSGVRTPLQGVYSGTIIVLALSFLAPYFYFIPKPTLAAVLITAASSLIDFEIFKVLWKCNKLDFFLTLFTFVIGTIKGVETAIVIGCICNALVLLKMWSRPNIYIEVKAEDKPGEEYLLIKPELGLYYPAADYLTESIKKAHKSHPHLAIAIDCSCVLKVDYAAAKTFESLLNNYNQGETEMRLINVNPKVKEVLKQVFEDDANMKLCKSETDLSNTINIFEKEDERPLLSYELERRKSSVKTSNSNQERKMSIYDLE